MSAIRACLDCVWCLPVPTHRRYEIKVILRAMHGWQVNIATKPDALEILAQCQLADKKWQVRASTSGGAMSAVGALPAVDFLLTVLCDQRGVAPAGSGLMFSLRLRVDDLTNCQCPALCFLMLTPLVTHSSHTRHTLTRRRTRTTRRSRPPIASCRQWRSIWRARRWRLCRHA